MKKWNGATYNKDPIITCLMKRNAWEQAEEDAASEFFQIANGRTEKPVSVSEVVLCRYPCAVEDYNELCRDILYAGSSPLNGPSDHRWIADFEYYDLLKDVTPKTVFDAGELVDNQRYVVKGKRDSKKFQWNTDMFAQNKHQAIDIMSRLSQDGWMQYQDIIFRDYVPLKKIGPDFINGLPCTNEWRFFVYYDEIVERGFYWDEIIGREELDEQPSLRNGGMSFAMGVADRIYREKETPLPFYVIDIAQKEDGGWMVVELNDGGMSGLCGIDPKHFYSRLYKLMAERYRETYIDQGY